MPLIFTLVVVTLVVAVLVAVDVIAYAYERIGLDRGWLLAAPGRFDHRQLAGHSCGALPGPGRGADARDRRVRGPVPVPAVVHTGTTILAVNVGGALIPAALASYLVMHDHLWLRCRGCRGGRSGPAGSAARVGRGIVTPTLVPPLAAALAATAIGGHAVAALAYVAGTVGTLAGTDLANVRRIRHLLGRRRPRVMVSVKPGRLSAVHRRDQDAVEDVELL